MYFTLYGSIHKKITIMLYWDSYRKWDYKVIRNYFSKVTNEKTLPHWLPLCSHGCSCMFKNHVIMTRFKSHIFVYRQQVFIHNLQGSMRRMVLLSQIRHIITMYDSPTDGQLTTNLVMNENSCTVKYIGLCLTGSHDCPHLHCIDVFSIMLNKDKH